MAVLVSDSFNRADSTASLGTTDSYNGGTVYTWASNIGTMGISTNQAYPPGTVTSDTSSYVDPGVSDCVVSAELINANTGYSNRIFFRITNSTNYWIADYTGSAFRLVKRVNSVYTVVLTTAAVATSTAPWNVSVTLNGSSITLTVNQQSNGTQLINSTVTDSFNQTATKHGIGGNNNVGRIDNFEIDSLASSGTAYTTTLTDSVATSETFAKAFATSASDAMTIAESFVKLAGKTVTDAQTLSDANVTKAAAQSKSDNLVTSDTLSKALTVTIVNTISLSESSGKADTQSLTDAITAADNPLTATKGKAVNLSDSIAITDAISKAISRTQTETISLSETKSDAAIRSLLDSLTVADTITANKGKAIILSDSISISDSIGKAALLSKLETLAMSDTFSKTSAVSVTLYDVIVSADNFNKSLPNAPTVIGHVQIKGSRQLHVAIRGSRQLHVAAKGGIPLAQTGQNVSMYAGESKYIDDVAVDINADGTTSVVNLSGATVKWVMKPNVYATALLTKDNASLGGVSITDAPNGKFSVQLNPNDTKTLNGSYYHEAKVTDSTGNVSVVSTGTITINPSGA